MSLLQDWVGVDGTPVHTHTGFRSSPGRREMRAVLTGLYNAGSSQNCRIHRRGEKRRVSTVKGGHTCVFTNAVDLMCVSMLEIRACLSLAQVSKTRDFDSLQSGRKKPLFKMSSKKWI